MKLRSSAYINQSPALEHKVRQCPKPYKILQQERSFHPDVIYFKTHLFHISPQKKAQKFCMKNYYGNMM